MNHIPSWISAISAFLGLIISIVALIKSREAKKEVVDISQRISTIIGPSVLSGGPGPQFVGCSASNNGRDGFNVGNKI